MEENVNKSGKGIKNMNINEALLRQCGAFRI